RIDYHRAGEIATAPVTEIAWVMLAGRMRKFHYWAVKACRKVLNNWLNCSSQNTNQNISQNLPAERRYRRA
ncbi:MAG: hypothetical protein WC977_08230, partial [Anaerovoracaceae bacterium]